MSRPSKLTLIHEQSRSYNKIKSKDIIDYLYRDFVPYYEIPDFPMQITSASGKVIEIVDDPAVIIGTATLNRTNKRVAVIAQQMPSSDAERARLNYGLVKADGYALSYNMMTHAEENGLMLHTYVDTIGGDPFEYSAGKLQSWLISNCQAKMISPDQIDLNSDWQRWQRWRDSAPARSQEVYAFTCRILCNNRRRLLRHPIPER